MKHEKYTNNEYLNICVIQQVREKKKKGKNTSLIHFAV